jgi:small-conductance mechanosensitive channel
MISLGILAFLILLTISILIIWNRIRKKLRLSRLEKIAYTLDIVAAIIYVSLTAIGYCYLLQAGI